MKKRKEFESTTNSRLYNILHKELHASCTYDRWHPKYWGYYNNDNKSWTYYGAFWKSYEEVTYLGTILHEEGSGKHPSWKLVSKNRKQWQGKPYEYHFRYVSWKEEWDEWVEFRWKVRKKQRPRG